MNNFIFNMKSSLKLFLLMIVVMSQTLFGDVLVNQLGYVTKSPKYVFVTGQADSFFVFEKESRAKLFSGSLTFTSLSDPATGFLTYVGDFSNFQTQGSYFIKTDLGDSSFTFSISDTVFESAYKKVQKAFYFQRCGTPLLQQYAGIYKHNICHNADAYFHSTTGKTGISITIGGWHDAGDFGKYIVNAGITVGSLLMAYEQFPERFNSDDSSIPESGNSIPDILDEVQYELEWFLKMQDSSGGVYFKVTRENFSGFVMPETDHEKRYIYQISTTATGDFAAVMAMAARIYQPFNSSFSDQCLSASEKAWLYLKANPSIQPAGGFKNPTGTFTGEYYDGNDSDERLWAASELFLTTGDTEYHNYFSNNYKSSGLISSMYWGSVKTLGLLDYLNVNQSNSTPAIKTEIKNSLLGYCSSLHSNAMASGLHTVIKSGEYYWGSNSDALNKAIILLFGFQQSGDEIYYNTALEQLNYILGINGYNISYVTGIGTKRVMHPHHRQSAADGIVEPIPGLMAGGPDEYLEDPVLQSHYTRGTPSALCYIDDQGSYASNEIAINWNAPLVFVLGYFNYEGRTTDINNIQHENPESFSLYQNYPNPFNPSTTIEYNLQQSTNVKLVVYNFLGIRIKTLVNSFQNSGKQFVHWNGKDDQNILVSSGVYIYKLEAGGVSLEKKMLFLK